MNKIDICSMQFYELTHFLINNMNEPPYRAKQIFSWLHENNVKTFGEMTSIQLDLRNRLQDKCCITNIKLIKKVTSNNGDSQKFLFSLDNNDLIETVLMIYHHGNSVCISTQAGCKMGCRFCASAKDGFIRNLTAGEMCGQLYEVKKATGLKINNIVMMGCGEPLDNYENCLAFIKIICQNKCISQRNITLSTCGIVPNIIKLANEKLNITLAVSIHTADEKLRNAFMPIATKYSLIDILSSCRYYIKKTNRRITIEYAFMPGINDTDEQAHKLLSLIKGLLCHVNLSYINDATDYYKKINNDKKAYLNGQRFYNVLKNHNISTTFRRKIGDDINAACGQLRSKHNSLV